jgi:putative spermidine/putrescine transport system substrate-binding protein
MLATVGVVAAAFPARGAVAAKQITVADPGGPYGPAFRKAFYDPFEHETGIQVVNVAHEPDSITQVRGIVETGSYTIDAFVLSNADHYELETRNLLEPIGMKPGEIPGLMPEAVFPNFFATDVVATISAYRTDKFATNGPDSWADFWNVEKFPGRRSLRHSPLDTLEEALLADGVPPAQLYPLDVDRAFRSLDKIKPHITVWWTGGAQTTQMLHSGEVDMIATWNARAQAAIDGGAPAKIVWNQGFYTPEGWLVPRGCPRAEDVIRFIRFCTDPQRQALFTAGLAYGPTNLDAYKYIPPQRAELLPTAPDHLKLMRVIDAKWWNANRDSVTDRFETWLIG